MYIHISDGIQKSEKKGKNRKKNPQKDRAKRIITTVKIVKFNQLKGTLPRWVKPANVITYYV